MGDDKPLEDQDTKEEVVEEVEETSGDEKKEPIVPDPEPQPEVPVEEPEIEEVKLPDSESVTTQEINEKKELLPPPKTTETGGAITTEDVHRLREEAKKKG